MGPDLDYMNRSLTNVRPSDETIEKIEELRRYAKDYVTQIFLDVPESPERTLACRALEESVMWAVKAMCLHDPAAQEQRIGASNAE